MRGIGPKGAQLEPESYPDNGCEKGGPLCETCNLPKCRYDKDPPQMADFQPVQFGVSAFYEGACERCGGMIEWRNEPHHPIWMRCIQCGWYVEGD